MALSRHKRSEASVVRRPVADDFVNHCMQLGGADAAVRRTAARELASYPEAVSELLAQLADEGEATVREAILTSLSRIGGEGVVEGVLDYLRSDDAALRNDVIELLKTQPDSVAAHMQGLLTDADPDVRIFAVNVLESLRHEKVVDWLLDVIERDPHVNVCATAVDLLAEVGDERAAEPLRRLRRRLGDDPFIAFAVDAALQKVGA